MTILARHGVEGGDDADSRSSDAYDEVRPSFVATSTNVSVSLGQTAVLRCRVHNLGDKTVSANMMRLIYRVGQKTGTIFVRFRILPNINQITKFFHCQDQEKIAITLSL